MHFREKALGDLFGFVRWVRIFRPAQEVADEEEGGRHSGLLAVSVPSEQMAGLEPVIEEIMNELTARQRLGLRRMIARQQAATAASLGMGAFAWHADVALSA